MRRLRYITLLFVCLMLNGHISLAQVDPEKICRIDGDRLVFTLDLKWTDQERKVVSELFDLDSLLLAKVFQGQTRVDTNGERWVVDQKGGTTVELSKSLTREPGEVFTSSDLFRVIDGWIKFAGVVNEIPDVYGVNRFSLINAFVFTGSHAQFYLPGNQSAGKVFLSGTFNNWSTSQTPMRRAGNGWMADVKLKPGKYTYKFIIDGRWTIDPSNLIREKGDAGALNSVVFCHNHIFTLKGFQNARNVVVTGNFFNWNPRGLSMNRTVDGWSLPAWFRDGTYAYKFLADGRWMTDPGNTDLRKDADGNENSFFQVGEPYLFKLKGYTSAEEVILTGSFNHWSKNELLMQKTADGWALQYVTPPGNYEYKFIADGEWMTDPVNPFSTGSGNYENSFIALKANHLFRLEGYSGAKSVIITGSFNGWSTRDYRMVREGGRWIFPMVLAPGKYTYKFIIDGEWILDPANRLYEENEYGTGNSVLWIEPGE